MREPTVHLEADLIHQAKAGNQDAYGSLYEEHIEAIYTYISRRVSTVWEAEDLAQTVFLKAWQALHDYKSTGAPFRSWLYRIAHNTVIDYYRTQRQMVDWEQVTTVTEPEQSPENLMLALEQREEVQTALTSLRPTYRAIITHRFFEELDYAETASILNRQVNNVRVLQHRALDALQRSLRQSNALGLALAALMMTLVLGTTVVQASTHALPGEALYPLRTWVEDGRLALANDAQAIQLHSDFAEQRLTDLQLLMQTEQRNGIDETVAQFTAHIEQLATQLTTQHIEDLNQTARAVDFAQRLEEQATTLVALRNDNAMITPASVQLALDAINAAREQLQLDIPSDQQGHHEEGNKKPITLIPTATAVPMKEVPAVDVAPQKEPDKGEVQPTPTPANLFTQDTQHVADASAIPTLTTLEPTPLSEATPQHQTETSPHETNHRDSQPNEPSSRSGTGDDGSFSHPSNRSREEPTGMQGSESAPDATLGEGDTVTVESHGTAEQSGLTENKNEQNREGQSMPAGGAVRTEPQYPTHEDTAEQAETNDPSGGEQNQEYNGDDAHTAQPRVQNGQDNRQANSDNNEEQRVRSNEFD